jgi:hypothetical protein
MAGVERPAIATLHPTPTGVTILVDAGGNVDCKPVHLIQFAIMGSVYAQLLLGKESPRIGLLRCACINDSGVTSDLEHHALGHSFFDAWEDCSIFDDGWVEGGIEVVSMPATFDYLRKHQDTWDRVTQWTGDNEEAGTCGMHIHLNRPATTKLQVFKMLRLLYSNKDFVLKVSERGSYGALNQWANIDYCNGTVKSCVNHFVEYDRYNVINLGNHRTLEFRLFNSTDRPYIFWKNVEFVQALYEYTLTCSLKNVHKLDEFTDWIVEHQNRFPNLTKWLADTDYILPLMVIPKKAKVKVSA